MPNGNRLLTYSRNLGSTAVSNTNAWGNNATGFAVACKNYCNWSYEVDGASARVVSYRYDGTACKAR